MLDIFCESGDGWARTTSRHEQRHHPRETVDECIEHGIPLVLINRVVDKPRVAAVVNDDDFGIRLAAGPRFGIGGAFERYLRVPFTLPPDKLEAAVLALRSAQDRLKAAPQLRRTLKSAPAVAIA